MLMQKKSKDEISAVLTSDFQGAQLVFPDNSQPTSLTQFPTPNQAPWGLAAWALGVDTISLFSEVLA
jgi:hypothetical protein